MDWAGAEQAIAKAAGDKVAELPFMRAKVIPDDHLSFEWGAFIELSTDRQSGFAIGPIGWSAIDRYAQRFDLMGDEFERFTRLMRAMDAAYLDWQQRKAEKAED